MMKFIKIAFLIVATIPFSCFSSPEQFNSVKSMMEEYNDFPPDFGAFKVLKDKPLSIQISPKVLSSESENSINEAMKRAAVYGIYRTLFQTPASSVSVTVVPLSIDMASHQKIYLDRYKTTFKISKDDALALAKKYAGISSADELMQRDGYEWTESFSKCCYWADGSAQFNKFFTELTKNK